MKRIALVVAYFQDPSASQVGKMRCLLGLQCLLTNLRQCSWCRRGELNQDPERRLSPDCSPSSSSALCPLLEKCFWRQAYANVGGLGRRVVCSRGDMGWHRRLPLPMGARNLHRMAGLSPPSRDLRNRVERQYFFFFSQCRLITRYGPESPRLFISLSSGNFQVSSHELWHF